MHMVQQAFQVSMSSAINPDQEKSIYIQLYGGNTSDYDFDLVSASFD